jgi:hypothetical protein
MFLDTHFRDFRISRKCLISALNNGLFADLIFSDLSYNYLTGNISDGLFKGLVHLEYL